MTQKRIIFAGTPDFAAVHLKALLDAGITPVAVYTQPDRPAGRGHKLTPSPVKKLAEEHGIEVRTPFNFKASDDVQAFAALKPDLCIVVAYGVILPQEVLDAPRLGCINVHGSLLPLYRGAAPIQRALYDGRGETGVSVMQLVKALDAGPVYSTASIKIEDGDTSGTLFDKLAILGATHLIQILPQLLEGELKAVPQDESRVTYASKLTKEEAALDFKQDARRLWLNIRAFNPWPVATAALEGVKYKIFSAAFNNRDSGRAPGVISAVTKEGIEIACGSGTLILKTIQAPGKGPVDAAALSRSCPQKFREGISFE